MTSWNHSWKSILWTVLLTVLGVACFPVNPLVLSGLIETEHYPVLYLLGWISWTLGMLLIMAPIIMFPRKGGVEKGKSFVHTSRLVETGIYGVVRHPQYLGGMLALFVTTFLWYPHLLFGVLGVAGIVSVYMSCREEDGELIGKFGNGYREYMARVPRVNIILGVVRYVQRKGEDRNEHND